MPGVRDVVPGADLLPEDNGPAPDQIADGGFAGEEAYETGGMLPPEVAPDFRDEVRRLLEEARAQGAAGETSRISLAYSR